MVFSSIEFMYFFLPAVLAGSLLLPGIRLKNLWLLLASLWFYARGEAEYTWVMGASILFNYAAGLCVQRVRDRETARRWITGLAVAGNLGLLGYFKYAAFLVNEVADPVWKMLGGAPLEIDPVHLPIGISFFTFQAMSYVVDFSRGETPLQRNPLKLGLYIAMFPQLIAGPIVRYRDVAERIDRRRVGTEDFATGVRIFTAGLGKKMILANTFAQVADGIFALDRSGLGTLVAWSGALAYTLQIYFDFSGYSDMAIGLGRMFGFQFPENFRFPYTARSVRDFWGRWHISLSTWFRDYLYIPLGGSRRSSALTYRNLLMVFFLCGLWHGASWNFIVWGLFHGAFLVMERVGSRHDRTVSAPWAHGYTLLVVMVGWVFFRAETLGSAADFLSAMAGFAGTEAEFHPAALWWNHHTLALLPVVLFACTPWPRRWLEKICTVSPLAAEATVLVGMVLIWVVNAMLLVAGTYNPFIYFRF